MFTSENKKAGRAAFLRYLIASGFCLLFGLIYEIFSHGVFSSFMTMMFLIPLIGGALPFGLMTFSVHPPLPDPLTRTMYGCAVATLTLGSCIRGILDIYGTTSHLNIIYLIAGLLLIAVALIRYISGIISAGGREEKRAL